jgi:DNA polymerase
MNYFLPDAKVTRDHGRAFQVGDRLIFPVFHPAAALRSTEMMKALEEDFKKLPAIARGEVTVEIPPSIITAPPREAKKTGKPKQEKLF